MSIGMITLVIVLCLLALLATGFPIAFCLLAISVAGFIVWAGPAALPALSSTLFSNSMREFLIAVPMFMLMAAVLQVSGVGTALYETMYKWMAGLRGGLAMGTVAISTVMAAMTGVGATSTLIMGTLAYPEMRRRGYNKHMAIGCITAGGCLGPLIPPSIPMIIVAGLGYLSIGKLFIAGVFPGLLTSAIFTIYIGLRCYLNPELGPAIPLAERANWRQKFVSLRGVALPVALIILVLGSIYMGIATPTEAGGVGAFGAFLCAAVYRNLNWQNVKNAVRLSLRVTAMCLWMFLGGTCFSTLLGVTRVADFIAEILTQAGATVWVPLAIMLVIVYVMGMFIDTAGIIVICIPIFMPVVRLLGIDPLWFGLIFTMDILIGFITPPFGFNIFYFKGLGHPDVSIADIYSSVLPFVVIMTVAWILCIVFPQIAVWLPNTMLK